MRNETKVGVVFGLLIVVVTSVYFYGSSRNEEEDVLTGLNRRGGAAAPIGPAEAGKPPVTTPGAVAGITPRTTPIQSGVAPRTTPASVSPTPAAVNSPLVQGPASATGAPRMPQPIGSGTAAPNASSGTLLADASAARNNVPSPTPMPPSPTPLRTGPSDTLNDATRRNLDGAGTSTGGAAANQPGSLTDSSKSGLDLGTIGDRIRRNSLDVVNPAGSTPNSTGSGAARSGSTTVTPPTPAAPNPVQPTGPRGSTAVPVNDAVARDAAAKEVWPKQHRVEYGETLYAIAIDYYGRSSAAKAILKANPDLKSPKALREGQVLVIPAPETIDAVNSTGVANAGLDGSASGTPSATRVPAGKMAYVVRDGDTFFTIAKKVLGDGKRWEEVYEANKSVVGGNPKRLKPGMTLVVPAKK